jgi:hypothetical protein
MVCHPFFQLASIFLKRTDRGGQTGSPRLSSHLYSVVTTYRQELGTHAFQPEPRSFSFSRSRRVSH